jgi:hypothetical protein
VSSISNKERKKEKIPRQGSRYMSGSERTQKWYKDQMTVNNVSSDIALKVSMERVSDWAWHSVRVQEWM